MRLGRSKRAGRRRVAATAAAAAMTASLLAACAQEEQGVVINLYGGASMLGMEQILEECNAAADGRYRIVGNLVPSDADGQREQMVRRMAAQDKSVDLLGLDVTWTAEFADAGWIRELTPEQMAASNEGTLQPTIDTTLWQDKQYAIPWHTNVQLLWYRKSLVPTPPETYDEMMAMSQQLKDQDKTYGISITAAQYEGYVVNVNTLINAYGGSVVNEDATKATVNSPQTIEALTLLKKLATSGLTSKSLSNAQEPEVFADMQNDAAAFSVNWPYVLSAMRGANPEIADDLGFAPLPVINKGDPPVATLGGRNLAVSTFSRHPEEAFEAAECIRNPEHQLIIAMESGEPPTHEPIYEQAQFREQYPMYEVMLEELKNGVPRPVTPMYQNISTVMSSTLSPPADIEPEAAAEQLQANIQDAIDGKGILP